MATFPLDATALIIIDMQKHFTPCALELVPRLNALGEAVRLAGMPVIWTQHGHPDPAKDAETSNLVRWWGPDNSIKYGSDGTSSSSTDGLNWLSYVIYIYSTWHDLTRSYTT